MRFSTAQLQEARAGPMRWPPLQRWVRRARSWWLRYTLCRPADSFVDLSDMSGWRGACRKLSFIPSPFRWGSKIRRVEARWEAWEAYRMGVVNENAPEMGGTLCLSLTSEERPTCSAPPPRTANASRPAPRAMEPVSWIKWSKSQNQIGFGEIWMKSN